MRDTARNRAKAAGDLRYRGGKVCELHPTSERYTSNGHCIGCMRDADVQKQPQRNEYKIEYCARPDTPRKKFYYHIEATFGLTSEAFDKLLIEQTGRCAVHDVQFSNNKYEPAVDHDYATDKVRGLLCLSCNTALHRSVPPDVHRARADYLERNS